MNLLQEKEFPLSNTELIELLKEVVCKKKASFRLRVKGASMSPFIKDGDMVAISPLSDSNTYFGMPMAVIHPFTGQFLIHRMVGINKNRYVIKGDNAPGFDSLFSKENILGIVTNVERKGEKIHFGFGPERFIIASLSRMGLLSLVFLCWRIFKHFINKAQGLSIYRKIVKLIPQSIEIKAEVRLLISDTAGVTTFVAKKEKKPVGSVHLVRYLDSDIFAGYWLSSLTTDFLYRGMGIGTKLTDAVIQKAVEEGAEELSLLVQEDNVAATRLYSKLGFKRQIIPKLEDMLEKEKITHGRRRIAMVKILAPISVPIYNL